MTLDIRRNTSSDRRPAPVRRGKDADRSSSKRVSVSRSSSGSVDASKPKDKATPADLNQPPTKIVIRRLPPSWNAATFLEHVSPLPDHDYFHFVPADLNLGVNAFSHAYINFVCRKDVRIFAEKFDGYIFIDERGNEHPAVVEFAPFLKVPKKRNKNPDARINTIEADPDYLKFLAGMEIAPTKSLLTPEVLLEEIETKEKELRASQCSKMTTPLIEFIVRKREEKKLAILNLREERRLAEIARRKQLEDERLRRIEKDRERRERERERERDRERERERQRLKEKEEMEKPKKEPPQQPQFKLLRNEERLKVVEEKQLQEQASKNESKASILDDDAIIGIGRPEPSKDKWAAARDKKETTVSRALREEDKSYTSRRGERDHRKDDMQYKKERYGKDNMTEYRDAKVRGDRDGTNIKRGDRDTKDPRDGKGRDRGEVDKGKDRGETDKGRNRGGEMEKGRDRGETDKSRGGEADRGRDQREVDKGKDTQRDVDNGKDRRDVDRETVESASKEKLREPYRDDRGRDKEGGSYYRDRAKDSRDRDYDEVSYREKEGFHRDKDSSSYRDTSYRERDGVPARDGRSSKDVGRDKESSRDQNREFKDKDWTYRDKPRESYRGDKKDTFRDREKGRGFGSDKSTGERRDSLPKVVKKDAMKETKREMTKEEGERESEGREDRKKESEKEKSSESETKNVKTMVGDENAGNDNVHDSLQSQKDKKKESDKGQGSKEWGKDRAVALRQDKEDRRGDTETKGGQKYSGGSQKYDEKGSSYQSSRDRRYEDDRKHKDDRDRRYRDDGGDRRYRDDIGDRRYKDDGRDERSSERAIYRGGKRVVVDPNPKKDQTTGGRGSTPPDKTGRDDARSVSAPKTTAYEETVDKETTTQRESEQYDGAASVSSAGGNRDRDDKQRIRYKDRPERAIYNPARRAAERKKDNGRNVD